MNYVADLHSPLLLSSSLYSSCLFHLFWGPGIPLLYSNLFFICLLYHYSDWSAIPCLLVIISSNLARSQLPNPVFLLLQGTGLTPSSCSSLGVSYQVVFKIYYLQQETDQTLSQQFTILKSLVFGFLFSPSPFQVVPDNDVFDVLAKNVCCEGSSSHRILIHYVCT